jgi:cell wall assembly regulator SMI1
MESDGENSIIQHLDSQLASLRPDYYVQLNPPLSMADIQALETSYSVLLPDDLKALYRWKNGQKSNCYQSFVNNSTFIPLEEALHTAKELTAMIGTDFEAENWWHPGWIPLFQNGGGDSICYDTMGVFTGVAGQLIEFWHADPDRSVIASSLLSFLQGLTQYYEITTPEKFDTNFTITEELGYPKLFSA